MSAHHSALLAWYHAHGRTSLPWRNTRDPYAIYLSEIMLQQTQVTTVLERFYFPFLERFPTLQSLADAPLTDVLKQWEGLGYYTRAGNLHKAAQQAAPQLPDTVEALLALPGIGRNTAHAVAAFAYGLPVPVLEANVKRVLSRVFALEQATEAELWDYAYQLLDAAHPFEYNQAMMDIGAYICTKTNPACLHCPLHSICQGKTAPEHYPAAKVKKAVPVREKVIIAYHDAKGRYHLAPRQSRFLQGLYGFAEYDSAAAPDLTQARQLGTVSQTYSHFRLEATVYEQQAEQPLLTGYTLEEIRKLPLSKADAKVLGLLVARYFDSISLCSAPASVRS